MNVFPDTSMNVYGIRVVEVTRPIWREAKKNYIEVSESMTMGDVFQFSKSSVTYRVISHAEYRTENGYTHKIKRTDCNSITRLDIETSKKSRVKIINRRTFKEDMEMAMKVYPPYNKHE